MRFRPVGCLLTGLVLSSWPVPSRGQREMLTVYRIMEGERTPYEVMGKRLVQTLELDRHLIVRSDSTNGSFDTLLQLDRKPHGIGIVQADVLYHYLKGDHVQFRYPKERSGVRALFPLFPEHVHIYVDSLWRPTPVSIASVESACCGTEGTGSLVTGLNIGEVLHARWMGALHMCDKFQSADLRLVVISPSRERKQLNDYPHMRLVWLTQPEARIIENAFPERIYRTTVRDTAYGPNPGYTIAVDAVLVGTRDLSNTLIETIENTIQTLREECKADILANTDLRLLVPMFASDSLCSPNLPIAAHPFIDMRRQNRFWRWVLECYSNPYGKAVLLGLPAVVGFLGALWTYWRRRKRHEGVPNLIYLAEFLFAFLLLHFIVATMMWLTEFEANSLQRPVAPTWGATCLWLVKFVLAGEPPDDLRSPYSLTALLVLKVGYLLSGALATFILTQQFARLLLPWLARLHPVARLVRVRIGLWMIRVLPPRVRSWLKGGPVRSTVILVGWNRRMPSLIQRLLGRRRQVYVIVPSGGTIEAKDAVKTLNDVVLLPGPVDRMFSQIPPPAIDVVIVVNQEPSGSSPGGDSATIVALEEVVSVLSVRPREFEKIKVLVELEDSTLRKVAFKVGATDVICGSDLNVGVLAQEALGYSATREVVEKLLSLGEHRQGVSAYELNRDERGLCSTFTELVQQSMKAQAARKPEERVQVIGILQKTAAGDVPILGSELLAEYEVQPNDRILVIGSREFGSLLSVQAPSRRSDRAARGRRPRARPNPNPPRQGG